MFTRLVATVCSFYGICLLFNMCSTAMANRLSLLAGLYSGIVYKTYILLLIVFLVLCYVLFIMFYRVLPPPRCLLLCCMLRFVLLLTFVCVW